MLAMNAYAMKEKNKRLLLKLILKSPVSRADLAKRSSLTKAAVSVIIDELISEGAIEEHEAKRMQVGRPPIHLSLKSGYKYAIGVDITRSHTTVGLMDIVGGVQGETQFPTETPMTTMKKVNEAILRILKESRLDTDKILGIGITAPGPIDTRNTTILNPPGFEAWHHVNVAEYIGHTFDKPRYLENISSGLALCEKYYGIAKDMPDFLLLTVNDGIGSGIILDNSLAKNASEVGHTSIRYDGIKCKCGNTGCIECYASIPRILENTPYSKWSEVVDNGDVALIEKEGEYLSCALVNATNTLGISSIILDGEITYKPEILISRIEKRLSSNTITKTPPSVAVSSGFNPVACAAVSAVEGYFNSHI